MAEVLQILSESLTAVVRIDHQQREIRQKQGKGSFQLHDAKQTRRNAKWESLEAILLDYGEYCRFNQSERAAVRIIDLLNGKADAGEDRLRAVEERTDLLAAVKSLPPYLQRFVQLRYFDGKHPITVRQILGISEEAFRKYRARALEGVENGMKVKIKTPHRRHESQCKSIFFDNSGKRVAEMIVPRRPDMLAFAFAKIFFEGHVPNRKSEECP